MVIHCVPQCVHIIQDDTLCIKNNTILDVAYKCDMTHGIVNRPMSNNVHHSHNTMVVHWFSQYWYRDVIALWHYSWLLLTN